MAQKKSPEGKSPDQEKALADEKFKGTNESGVSYRDRHNLQMSEPGNPKALGAGARGVKIRPTEPRQPG